MRNHLTLVVNNPKLENVLAQRMVAQVPHEVMEPQMWEWWAFLKINSVRDQMVRKLGHEHLITEGLAGLLCEISKRWENKRMI